MTMDLDLLTGNHRRPLSDVTSRRLLKQREVRALSCRTTCIHPQLRDLLVCEQAGQVVGHSYHAISRYTFGKRGTGARGTREHLQSLKFIPNCLVSGCGILAAGGHNTELALCPTDPHASWCLQTNVGNSINNSINITPSPTDPLATPQIHISNNDSSIYRFNAYFPKLWGSLEVQTEWQEGEIDPATNAAGGPELDYLERIRLDTPINHTSVSPDGRTMVAVGDTSQVFVFDVSSHGSYRLIDTVQASEDASFSTSWSRTGESFAVASQDGCVTIFDRRHLQPMKQFHTHQRGTSAGAARVVKYSNGPHELLAFTEQKSYVHVVDARTYEHQETIHLPSTEVEESQKLTHLSTAQQLHRNAIRQPLQPTELDRHSPFYASPSTSRSVSPWDTMPSEAYAVSSYELHNCPPDDFLTWPLRGPASSPVVMLPSSRSLSSAPPPRSSTPTSFTSRLLQSAPAVTVSSILGAPPEDEVSLLGSDGTPASSTAITGLDWDPTGRYLYASMERIILEWQVDSESRRCHPHYKVL